METLIKDLKKVITSNIEDKNKYCELLINDFLVNFVEWYNEDKEKTPITIDEINLFIKEKS